MDIYEREKVIENVVANEPGIQRRLDDLRRIPIVGDVRGMGHFWALELVKDQGTKQTFEGEEADWLLRRVLSAQLYENGLLCRLDDRGDPVVQLSPPLVADDAVLDRIVSILGDALEHAAGLVASGAGPTS